MGLPLTNARVAIESTGEPRGLVVPMLFAESCGGVVSGRAAVYPAMDWAGPGERSYETSLIFSGLKLNEALDGFASARPDAKPRDPRKDTGARLEGQLTLGGLVGNEDSRRGSLSVQIAGGDVIAVPVGHDDRPEIPWRVSLRRHAVDERRIGLIRANTRINENRRIRLDEKHIHRAHRKGRGQGYRDNAKLIFNVNHRNKPFPSPWVRVR